MQAPSRESPLQHLVGARLGEWHFPAVHRLNGRLADVVNGHIGAPVSESESERQTHVPASPDDDHVPVNQRFTSGCFFLGSDLGFGPRTVPSLVTALKARAHWPGVPPYRLTSTQVRFQSRRLFTFSQGAFSQLTAYGPFTTVRFRND